jgi:Cu(I)/Ag(I) efflux system membrane fusion protein
MQKLLLLLLLISLFGCKTKKAENIVKDADEYYTCSMHPQIIKKQPGNCPVCGMQLIVVQKSNAMAEGEIKLSEEQIRLGNIQYDTIKNNLFGDRLLLTATLNFDQSKIISVNSKVMGRIEHLYFKNMGDYVKKGDKLFDIYSEELNNAKQEYLSAVERKNTLGNAIIDFNQLIKSAKNKLLLWGLSEKQIEALQQNQSSLTAVYSKASGYITSMDIKEGDYVMEGGVVMRLADLSTLWAEAQVYASQLALMDKGGSAIVEIPDIPGKKITSTIEFINPEINADTRINLIRVSVPNEANAVKPGMPAFVEIKSRNHNALTLPIDAVLRDANGATVWVKSGNSTFKIKRVETGLEKDDVIEIKKGLSSGDVIVISGAYLLNSEYIFKNGTNPVASHNMDKM